MSAPKQHKVYQRNMFSVLSSDCDEIKYLDGVAVPPESSSTSTSTSRSSSSTTSRSSSSTTSRTSTREEGMELYSGYNMSDHLRDIYIWDGKISLPLYFCCLEKNVSWIIYSTGVGNYKARYCREKENIFSELNSDSKLDVYFSSARVLYGWIESVIDEGDEFNSYMLRFIGTSSVKIFRSGNRSKMLLDMTYFLDTYLINIWIDK